jgi:NADP-dependent 3-hydroxy acid dehydrogenase YdfG
MIVKALEENGAKVYVVGRRKEVIEKVAKEHAVRPSLMTQRNSIL